jgi:plastocyanin
VNSGILLGGGFYTVQFPTAGNFKVVCLLHTNMTGVVHVLEFRDRLPHNQAFYDSQAALQRSQLLSDGARLSDRGLIAAATTSRREVTAGIGEIVATGGGAQTISVNRFLDDTIVVRVGQSVEWTNLDPVTPHTITFGTEPDNPVPPSQDVSPAPDGALRASLGSPGDSTNSGLIVAEIQDRIGAAPTPPGLTRFRVTFHGPGVYKYICALHDDLGMKGRVIVVP